MEELERKLQALLDPSETLIRDLENLDGDILILGIGGKIGPSLARLAKKAVQNSGKPREIMGVSRFSDPELKAHLQKEGIRTFTADLLNEDDLQSLPNVRNIIYLAGTKFGTTGNESFTWAMNTYLPGRIAEKYKDSKIVVYSTGNVYPFTPVISGGADEDMDAAPIGEYGQSCLGRERVFQYFSEKYKTPLLIYRLNYANDLRYGVLSEIAKAVRRRQPIDLSMGHVNIIWQGDANEIALRSLHHCSIPAKLLNVTGPETASVRWIACEFGKRFGQIPVFEGVEQSSALLSNAAEAFHLFGYPRVSLKQMIDLTAEWMLQGKETIEKPTHFQERAGKY